MVSVIVRGSTVHHSVVINMQAKLLKTLVLECTVGLFVQHYCFVCTWTVRVGMRSVRVCSGTHRQASFDTCNNQAVQTTTHTLHTSSRFCPVRGLHYAMQCSDSAH